MLPNVPSIGHGPADIAWQSFHIIQLKQSTKSLFDRKEKKPEGNNYKELSFATIDIYTCIYSWTRKSESVIYYYVWKPSNEQSKQI